MAHPSGLAGRVEPDRRAGSPLHRLSLRPETIAEYLTPDGSAERAEQSQCCRAWVLGMGVEVDVMTLVCAQHQHQSKQQHLTSVGKGPGDGETRRCDQSPSGDAVIRQTNSRSQATATMAMTNSTLAPRRQIYRCTTSSQDPHTRACPWCPRSTRRGNSKSTWSDCSSMGRWAMTSSSALGTSGRQRSSRGSLQGRR